MTTRYYMMPSGSDMTVMAYVAPLDPIGDANLKGHSVSVRMVKAGEWYQAVVEGEDQHETFVMACTRAEEKLLELRRLVYAEGHRFDKLGGDIYILRRLISQPKSARRES